MPTGTKVDSCFQKLKTEKGEGHAAAICQGATGQNLHTGQSLAEKFAALERYEEGKPCKPGETAAKDRCIPAEKKSSGTRSEGHATDSKSRNGQQPESKSQPSTDSKNGQAKPQPKEQSAPADQGRTQKPIYVDGDIKKAAQLLSEGKRVQLDQPEEVCTLLDKMYRMVKDAEALGQKAPQFDLCKISVPGTNLFCQESKGVPRIQMPQMRGFPEENSPAAKKEKNRVGKVDISEEFIADLQKRGIKVKQKEIRASHLRASQAEIDGKRVAEILVEAKAGVRDLRKRPIFVTRDNYVLDGHHHWAAIVGLGYSKDKDLKVPVYKLDMDIGQGIFEANAFAKKMGLKPKAVGHADGTPSRIIGTKPAEHLFSEGAGLKDAEVFSTGTHRGKSYTAADLDDMVENFKKFSAGSKPLLRVPAVIGHEESQEYLERSDLPAAAWTQGLRNEKRTCPDCKGGKTADGQECPTCAGTGTASTLKADFGDIPDQVKRLLKSKAYRTVSAEVYDEPPEGVPGKGKMLRRVAFLGGEIPQVKRLEDIPAVQAHRDLTPHTAIRLSRPRFEAAKKPGLWHCFSEAKEQPMNHEEMIAKLAHMGYDTASLEGAPDPTLSEILRVSGSGEGKPSSDEANDGNGRYGEDTGTGELPEAANDDEKKKFAERARSFMARAKKMMEKYCDSGDMPQPSAPRLAHMDEDAAGYIAESYETDRSPTPTPQGPTSPQPRSAVSPDSIAGSVTGRQPTQITMKYSELEALITRVLDKRVGQNLKQLEKFAEETTAAQKKLAIDSFCESRLKAGKISPAEMDSAKGTRPTLFDRLMRADSRRVVHKFRESGKEVSNTELDLQMNEIDARSPFYFGERYKQPGKTAQSPDGEIEKVEQHFEMFKENFHRVNPQMTSKDLVTAFQSNKKRNPELTAEQYLTAN